MSAQLKVRNYILNLIYQHQNGRVQIPSYSELAVMLEVARSSVQLALKQLIREKYLTAKVGIGTFSNPQHGLTYRNLKKIPPRIGLFAGDGRIIFFPYCSWQMLSAVGNNLVRRGFVVQLPTLAEHTPEGRRQEIESQMPDGILWVQPENEMLPVIRQLGKTIPLVVIGKETDAADCVFLDEFAAGMTLGKEMLRAGRRDLVFSCRSCAALRKMEGVREAFREAGVPLPESAFLKNQETFYDDLEARLKAGQIPDAVYFNPEETGEVIELLHRYKVDIPKQCLPVSGMMKLTGVPEKIAFQRVDFEELGKIAAGLLADRMEHPELAPRKARLVNDKIICDWKQPTPGIMSDNIQETPKNDVRSIHSSQTW